MAGRIHPALCNLCGEERHPQAGAERSSAAHGQDRIQASRSIPRTDESLRSSFPDYAGVDATEQQSRCGLTIDRVSRRRGTSR